MIDEAVRILTTPTAHALANLASIVGITTWAAVVARRAWRRRRR